MEVEEEVEVKQEVHGDKWKLKVEEEEAAEGVMKVKDEPVEDDDEAEEGQGATAQRPGGAGATPTFTADEVTICSRVHLTLAFMTGKDSFT